MTIYIVAIRHKSREKGFTAEHFARQVLGTHIKEVANAYRVTIEASPQSASELERRFGDDIIVEREILHFTS